MGAVYRDVLTDAVYRDVLTGVVAVGVGLVGAGL